MGSDFKNKPAKRSDNNNTPHYLVRTKKTVIHGWHFSKSSGRRECSSERILVNPYNGCTVNCPSCYTRAYGGYFDRWNREGAVAVFEDIDQKLVRELSKLRYAACGYFSPVTDPFQHPLESTYRLSEKCMNAFLELDLPVEFVTKNGPFVPERLLRRMSEHPYNHCFAQYTILSTDKEKQKWLAPGGATAQEQINAARRSADLGLYTVVRIDPIIPGINDCISELSTLVTEAKNAGSKHIIASVGDLSYKTKRQILASIKPISEEAYALSMRIYRERQGSSCHATLEFRLSVFKLLKDICTKHGLTFALCMEFSKSSYGYKGLNDQFMTSIACEGKEVPMYYRRCLSDNFKPIEQCKGSCLSCAERNPIPVCRQRIFPMASALKYSDYLRLTP